MKKGENENTITGGRALLAGAGEFTGRGLEGPWDLVIAADGGLASLERAGMVPDLVVGDFDSLGYVPGGKACAKPDSPERKDTAGSAPEGIPKEGPGCWTEEDILSLGKGNNPGSAARSGGKMKKEGPEILRLPVEKDDTDMAAACRIAWERGCRSIRIYGGSGDRPDHFLANLQLAAHYSRMGGDLQLVAPDFTVYVVTDGAAELRSGPGVTFSVFSLSDRAEGVTIEGEVKYPLSGACLTNTRALGVSNLMTGNEARVAVRKGTLLVFLYWSPLRSGRC